MRSPPRAPTSAAAASQPTGVARDERHPCAARDGQAGGLQPDPARAPGDHDVCVGELASRRRSSHASPRLASHRVPPPPARQPAASRWRSPVLATLVRSAATGASAPTFTVQPSVEQVAVTGATAGATAVLRGGRRPEGRVRARSTPPAACSSATWARARATSSASRNAAGGAGDGARARPTRRRSRSTPASTSAPGFGYLKTRDGTMLSVNVTLPGPVERGPLPHRRRVLGLRPVEPRQRRNPRRGSRSCSASPPSA